MASRRYVETKITRLQREIAEIENFFYHREAEGDRAQWAGMLERKRDDVVRAAVLQLHTGIEDLLNSLLICRVLDATPRTRVRRMRSPRGRALRKVLLGAGSMGFDLKLNLAVALRVLSSRTARRLTTLNTIRNKVSHNWLLTLPVRHGRRPNQTKPPLLVYEGRALHQVEVLKAFVGEYGTIYVRLFLRYLG